MYLLIPFLLILPGLAVYRLFGETGLYCAGGWVGAISLVTYWRYATDKQQARNQGERTAESTLHLCELLGGWPGAFIAQRRLRHKSSKGSYLFVFTLIIGLHQFIAIDALRGWPFAKVIWNAIGKL